MWVLINKPTSVIVAQVTNNYIYIIIKHKNHAKRLQKENGKISS